MNTIEIEGTPRVTIPAALLTADELLLYAVPDKRIELVRGRLVVRDLPGMRHGESAARVIMAIGSYLISDRDARGAAQTRGRVLTCDSGFVLERNPDTVRGPDISYLSRERWAGPLSARYGEGAPDLAVEIRSPSDRPGAVLAKIGDYLEAGAQLVWVVDPGRQNVSVYRSDGSQSVLSVDDSLDGGDVLPGFAYSIAELFAD